MYCNVRFPERVLEESFFVCLLNVRWTAFLIGNTNFLLQRGEKMTRDEVSAIIKQADFNCSGKLDYNKVQQTEWHSLFLYYWLGVIISITVIKWNTYHLHMLVCRWPCPSPPQLPVYWNMGWSIFLFHSLDLATILEKVTYCKWT